MNAALIRKYDVAGPRYTSYPTVPYWEGQTFDTHGWKSSIQRKMTELKGGKLSLYIHLPYCESMCTFCGCMKHITKRHEVESPYIDALLKEWELYRRTFPNKPVLQEMHLGGGTPTFFSPGNLERLIRGILDTVQVPEQVDFGFEGHPNNTTREHLETLFQLGFRRVSFGVQDYDPTVQKAINRHQSFEQVEQVHRCAEEIGYTSISHDLVFGLPFQREETITQTIARTNELRPQRISLYSYAHVPWIKGVGQRGFSEADLPSGPEKRALYELARKALLKNGYQEIGMDHFALPEDGLAIATTNGTLYRNFMGYTSHSSDLLIGLGVSAISDSGYAYGQNEKTIKDYLHRINSQELPVFRGHLLTDQDLILRKHILDLMCRFDTTLLQSLSMQGLYDQILERLQPLVRDRLVRIDGGRIRVLPKGRMFVRNICMCFDVRLQDRKPTSPTFSATV